MSNLDRDSLTWGFIWSIIMAVIRPSRSRVIYSTSGIWENTENTRYRQVLINGIEHSKRKNIGIKGRILYLLSSRIYAKLAEVGIHYAHNSVITDPDKDLLRMLALSAESKRRNNNKK